MQITEDPIPKWYPIDWNKVSTVGDVKFILSNMGLGCSEDAPNYQVLKRILDEHYANKRNWGSKIWSILMFQNWFDNQ